MNKVLVVGSLHYDIMVNTPHRPETGETVIGTDCAYKFGGKGGNQAVSVAKSHVDVRFVGAVGDDANGQLLLSNLQENGIDIQFVEKIANMPSGMSVAITDTDGDYSAIVIPNANTHIDINQLANDQIWEGGSLLLLQNEIPEKINAAAARQAKKRGIKVCLNAAPAKELPRNLIKQIDLLVVNAIEARDMTGITVSDLNSAAKAALLLSSTYPTVVVTAGEHGVAFFDPLKGSGRFKAEKIKLVSTHGAGDCFMGALCASLATNTPLLDAIYRANKAAAIHVSSPTSYS